MKEMNKYSYFLMGLKNRWFLDSYWIKSCFSVFKTKDTTPYLVKTNEKGFYFIQDGEEVLITGATDITKPLLRVGEMITVPMGTFPGQKEEIKTSCGILFQNYLMVIDPFNGKVPFINKRFFPSDVEKFFLYKWERSRDDITEDKPEKPDEIFTEEFLKYTENTLHLVNYTQTFVPSITEKSLTTNPLLEKRRKELYAEYGDRLNDPVIAAKVDAELVAIDKEFMKGDDSMGFLISGKAFNNTRKRLNNNFGTPSTLDDKPGQFITRSLKEGVDYKNLSVYVNDAYNGSIGRGLETQEGGVLVKDALRSAANLKVEGDDCGSTHGVLYKMPDDVDKCLKYIGYWYIVKGTSHQVTNENIKDLAGKYLLFRAPSMCTSKNNSYCRKCVGPNISNYENGIATVNSSLGSVIMNLSMKNMHSKVVSTTKWRNGVLS